MKILINKDRILSVFVGLIFIIMSSPVFMGFDIAAQNRYERHYSIKFEPETTLDWLVKNSPIKRVEGDRMTCFFTTTIKLTNIQIDYQIPIQPGSAIDLDTTAAEVNRYRPLIIDSLVSGKRNGTLNQILLSSTKNMYIDFLTSQLPEIERQMNLDLQQLKQEESRVLTPEQIPVHSLQVSLYDKKPEVESLIEKFKDFATISIIDPRSQPTPVINHRLTGSESRRITINNDKLSSLQTQKVRRGRSPADVVGEEVQMITEDRPVYSILLLNGRNFVLPDLDEKQSDMTSSQSIAQSQLSKATDSARTSWWSTIFQTAYSIHFSQGILSVILWLSYLGLFGLSGYLFIISLNKSK